MGVKILGNAVLDPIHFRFGIRQRRQFFVHVFVKLHIENIGGQSQNSRAALSVPVEYVVLECGREVCSAESSLEVRIKREILLGPEKRVCSASFDNAMV